MPSKSLPVQDFRITARVPESVRNLIEQAATLSGSSINQFLVQAALKEAQSVIEKECSITLTLEGAQAFFDALENPPAPNSKMVKLATAYKNSGIYERSRNRRTQQKNS